MAKNHSKEFVRLSRWEIVNFWKSHKQLYKDSGFLKRSFLKWLFSYFSDRFGRKHPYIAYPIGDETGVFPLKSADNNDNIVVNMVSDWATDTISSDKIGTLMKFSTVGQSHHISVKTNKKTSKSGSNADFTLNLGDIYFVGDAREVEANFGEGSSWAFGRVGSLSVPGNHEFYSRGHGFFKNLLSKMYAHDPENQKKQQKAPFFCLENDYWRIIGLDTGYNSSGWPIIEVLFPPRCSMRKEQYDWLKNVVKLSDPNDKRGVIFLSHHQYFSAFEKGHPRAGQQIAEIIGKDMANTRNFLWFWGHEHRLAIFDLNKVGEGIKAYGRCIGHGGMPITLAKPEKTYQGSLTPQNNILQFYDNKPYRKINNVQVARNGYVRLCFNQSKLTVDYIQLTDKDEKNFYGEVVLTEGWSVDTETGSVVVEKQIRQNNY